MHARSRRPGRTPEWELVLWHLASLRDAAVAAVARRFGRVGRALPAGLRRAIRRLALLVWWSLTLQLPRHLALWLAARRARAARPPVAAAPRAQPCPLPEEIALPPAASHPVVSVIITSYGAVPHTLRCLAALARDRSGVALEVIVIDDAAPDPEVAVLARVPGLRLIRNPARLGYLRSCNEGAAAARGAYLLLLNNDTEPAPDAIAAMLALFRARPDTGAVGARLLFPDGCLQEAGGIIWRDGSGWNYGRGDDPDKPEYNYVREVDYCSAAALMLPRALFARLGGFDPRYAPAYYEDTDLAFRLRDAGHPVLYQPRARVVHVEGVSHGTDPAAGGKAYQLVNRTRFTERWAAVLASEHYEPGTHVLRARDHARRRQVVLVLDHYVPQPDRDAGSCNILNYIDALLADGAVVKFWPHNREYSPGYTEALQDRGVEVFHGGRGEAFAEWIAAQGGALDLVLLSRPDVAQAALASLKRHTGARLVYYGHDLHFRRLRLQAEVTGDAQAAAAAARMERIERWVWRSVDLVLYPSAEEATTVAGLEPGVRAQAVPAFGFVDFGQERAPPEGADLLFVGGFAHPPNEAAVLWFVRQILPLVQARHPAARLVVAGSHPGPQVRALEREGVVIRADLAAGELRALYRAARVVVAPLRYGAGVKLKVAEALREGTPLVTTTIGAQGLAGIEQVASIADDPAAFAAAVTALLDDPAWWQPALCRATRLCAGTPDPGGAAAGLPGGRRAANAGPGRGGGTARRRESTGATRSACPRPWTCATRRRNERRADGPALGRCPLDRPPGVSRSRLARRRLVRPEAGHIDHLAHRGVHRQDLHRVGQPDQHRADRAALGHLRRQPRGDMGRVQPRHHQHVGRPGQPAERIQRAQLRLQRDIRAHFAVIFEIHLALHPGSRPPRASPPRPSASPSPKVVCDSSATRGSWPRWRAVRAAPIAISASCSALGRKCIIVSAMNRVRPRRPTSTDSPKAMAPGAGSIAWPMSSRQTWVERVRPVTIASASPVATMQAANTLRSWLTMRWQSRARKPRRCSRPYRNSMYLALASDSRALWISIPSMIPRPRPAMVARTRSSRPISTGVP